MAKYLITANYSTDGMKGALADGGTSRKTAIEALAASVGGSVDMASNGNGSRLRAVLPLD